MIQKQKETNEKYGWSIVTWKRRNKSKIISGLRSVLLSKVNWILLSFIQ